MEESGEDAAKTENAEGQSGPWVPSGQRVVARVELFATKCVGYIAELNFFSTSIGQHLMISEVPKGGFQGFIWGICS